MTTMIQQSNNLEEQGKGISQQCRQLPPPRIWHPHHLATFLGFSRHWVYKKTKAGANDPPPRCKGLSRIRFDSSDPEFQAWLSRQLEPR